MTLFHKTQQKEKKQLDFRFRNYILQTTTSSSTRRTLRQIKDWCASQVLNP